MLRNFDNNSQRGRVGTWWWTLLCCTDASCSEHRRECKHSQGPGWAVSHLFSSETGIPASPAFSVTSSSTNRCWRHFRQGEVWVSSKNSTTHGRQHAQEMWNRWPLPNLMEDICEKATANSTCDAEQWAPSLRHRKQSEGPLSPSLFSITLEGGKSRDLSLFPVLEGTCPMLI